MFKYIRIGLVVAGLIYGGIFFFEKIWLVAAGDPSTPEGYIRLKIKHEMLVGFGKEEKDTLFLSGYLLNGGDRELDNIEVRVYYAPEHGDTTKFKTINLGHFDVDQQRRFNRRIMEWYEDEIWWEIEIADVKFATAIERDSR